MHALSVIFLDWKAKSVKKNPFYRCMGWSHFKLDFPSFFLSSLYLLIRNKTKGNFGRCRLGDDLCSDRESKKRQKRIMVSRCDGKVLLCMDTGWWSTPSAKWRVICNWKSGKNSEHSFTPSRGDRSYIGDDELWAWISFLQLNNMLINIYCCITLHFFWGYH